MKSAIHAVSILLFTARVVAIAGETPLPQFRAAIVCFNGKLDSGSSCASNPAPVGQPLAKSGQMSCGFPGKVSEITWSFVERRNGKDVYSFTRRFPVHTPQTASATKEIHFNGERVIAFEDAHQIIVIQSPKK